MAKQIAYLETENGFRIVTVYQAIQMKNNQIKNRGSRRYSMIVRMLK